MNQIKIFQIWPPESNVSVFLDCWRRDLGQTLIQSDRKSTRLNSSHVDISYAVFCLKKKKKHNSARSNYIISLMPQKFEDRYPNRFARCPAVGDLMGEVCRHMCSIGFISIISSVDSC